MTRRFLIIALALTALSMPVYAQAVDIPDASLQQLIRDTLGLPHHAPITKDAMAQVEELWGFYDYPIVDLTGLEHAINLRRIEIDGTPIGRLEPLANLSKLEFIQFHKCGIVDLRPLSGLTGLVELLLNQNNIVSLEPVAGLTNLRILLVGFNRIMDYSPIAQLTNLKRLQIVGNPGSDYTPLQAIEHNLDEFLFDEVCDMEVLSRVSERINGRTFPSVFAPWGHELFNRPDLIRDEMTAQHDLWFGFRYFGLHFRDNPDGTVDMVGTLDRAIAHRQRYLDINPNMVFITGMWLRTAPEGLIADDNWWVRDENGNRVYAGGGPDDRRYDGWDEYLLNFTLPEVQDWILKRIKALAKCELQDGIFFEFWTDMGETLSGYVPREAQIQARLNIARRVREEVRPDFLILGNTNEFPMPLSGPYINGGFMESGFPVVFDPSVRHDKLLQLEDSLRTNDATFREPRINLLEFWFDHNEPHNSPDNLRSMRLATTMVLTQSDGYVVVVPGYVSRHHYWYDFWDADLGTPVSPKAQLYQEIEGLYIREFTNGWAVYNRSGEHHVITLPEEAQGVASGLAGTEHALANLDGEMYLRVKPKNPADVNGDGIVNILDLTLVAQALGTAEARGDVNGDGVVNVFDLVIVAEAF